MHYCTGNRRDKTFANMPTVMFIPETVISANWKMK